MAHLLYDSEYLFGIKQETPLSIIELTVGVEIYGDNFLPIKWAVTQGIIDQYVCTHGRADQRCHRCLYEKLREWNGMSCNIAAANGQLECLKYLHRNGCKWNDRAYIEVIKNGHLEVLKYLHENGSILTMSVCNLAVAYGQLECLRYAHEED